MLRLSLRCAAVAALSFATVFASDQIQHKVTFLGPASTITGMSDAGFVIGTNQEGDESRGWVWAPGSGMQDLQAFPGSFNVMPLAVNDSGTVVGLCDAKAVAWTIVGDSTVIQELPGLRGATENAATAINNQGDIVGYSLLPGEWRAVLFNGPVGVIDLTELGFAAIPSDINNDRVMVGGNLKMDLDKMRVLDLGLPRGMVAAELRALNEVGQATGFAQLPIPVVEDLVPVRYTDGVGWEVLSMVAGPFTQGYDINDEGDVVFTEPVSLYTDKFGVVRLDETIAARTDPESWVFPPYGGLAINDCGKIAAIGNNLNTGEYGAVLLSRVGWTLLGDLDNDGDVDESDLAILLSVFGTEGKLGDLDGDLDVDVSDLGLLLANFGKSCPT